MKWNYGFKLFGLSSITSLLVFSMNLFQSILNNFFISINPADGHQNAWLLLVQFFWKVREPIQTWGMLSVSILVHENFKVLKNRKPIYITLLASLMNSFFRTILFLTHLNIYILPYVDDDTMASKETETVLSTNKVISYQKKNSDNYHLLLSRFLNITMFTPTRPSS